ncbi:MAG: hypothetical protein HY926_15680 [Elusimicrobia bacterium]|nr:hypothetical protein [Elusimicrobiota bacterium]
MPPAAHTPALPSFAALRLPAAALVWALALQPAAAQPLDDEGAEAGPQSSAVPPGLQSDRAGGLLRYGGEEWVVVNTLRSYSWSAAGGWQPAGPVREANKAAIRNAVEKFNAVPGLRLRLRYEESDDPELFVGNFRRHQDRFVIYWAEDAEEGGLAKPFSWHPKRGYKGGTLTFIKDRRGRRVSLKSKDSPEGPLAITGAAIFARERIRHATDLARCKTDAPYYAFLHEIGHALGMGHATPGPSIMRGTCGESYLPNDIANLRSLYGP